MTDVLNPKPESTTLNTEFETSTLEQPATELEQPPCESTSTPETHDSVEVPALDADAPTLPAVDEAPETEPPALTEPEAAAQSPGEDPLDDYSPPAPASEYVPAEFAEDFSAALEAFEREQAAEAAAVEAYGDKIVPGKVIELREKYLVVDVGLKSEGLVPLEQVLDTRRGPASSLARRSKSSSSAKNPKAAIS